MGAIVAIVGRPNVGKDRHYGKAEWCGREFSVIDTGGYTSNSDDIFEEEIRKQVSIAIEEADLILFLCEVKTGITDYDSEIANILRRVKKPVIPVVNKIDSGNQMYEFYEFNALGLGEPFAISAVNGSGTGDLLDRICELLPPDRPEETNENIPKITIVGRPNVGKSSITNAFLGEDRNIVTPIAGTTRDSISTRYNKFGYNFMLIDTAGLRKKGKVTEDLEFYSVMRAIRSIENSDICILMVDAQTGVEAQDMAIFNLIVKNKKGCVIVVNKWDTVKKENNTMKQYTELIRKRIAPFSDVPVIFTSVINKQRIFDVLAAADKVYKNYTKRIPTSELNEIMLEEIENYPPPATKGKFVKIKYLTQLPTKSPSFAFFCNLPQYVKEPYRRFLENKIRAHFDFTGVPIQIFLRQK